MMIAQQLYEGIEVGDAGSVGLITYMRTDSVHLSEKFVMEARSHITASYGASYCPKEIRRYKTKSKLAQEAHEAIRPTAAERTPEEIQSFLTPQQWKVYSLIWRRAIASQMEDALLDATTVDIRAGTRFDFRVSGSVIRFDGFLRAAQSDMKTTELPTLNRGDALTSSACTPEQHFTEPPPRYSDATLVKALEERGIGRPSTYAPTISTIIDRRYVERIEGKKLKPTDIGIVVTDLLVEHFPQIVDYTFTASLEDELDAIAENKKEWVPVLRAFYTPFKKQIEEKTKTLNKKDITEEKTDEICEKCGKPMVVKLGRYGKFLACSGYPDCRNTKPLPGEERDAESQQPLTTDEVCEACGAPMVVKRGRYGPFLSCSKYPECKTMKPFARKLNIPCPECKEGELVLKRSKRGRTFTSCNRYPTCTFALWSRPTGEKCPECHALLVFAKQEQVRCSNKTCTFTK